MSASTPVLYIFAISHYCDKARWALEYLGINYELRHVAPGEHRMIAKKLGAAGSSVPYLNTGRQVIQGSANIIDWADAMTTSSDRRLTPDIGYEECRKIENRIDDIAGVHVRRYYYSEALVEYPETVRPIFTRNLSLYKKLLIGFGWGKLRNIMIVGMDLGTEQGRESRDIIEGELEWIDGLLSDGRKYLVGNQFSRADMAVASLLAPLVLPPQHPTYAKMKHPPKMAQDIAGWAQRPSLSWTRQIYAQHR